MILLHLVLIIIFLETGISYNSYFIDDEKTCILDAVDNAARDLFLGM